MARRETIQRNKRWGESPRTLGAKEEEEEEEDR
jgi:hypothetical protein